MLFNSLDFGIFIVIFFFLYFYVFNKSVRYQNFLILVSSWIFYAYWDWRFLSLILFSSFLDYFIGLKLKDEFRPKFRKGFLWLSLIINLGILFFFKYFNFFIDNLNDSLSLLGFTWSLESLNIILPVGISFYTFQTLSYTIDVYRKKIIPTTDFVVFASYVSFFPQLVAGPIERASNLISQFEKERRFNSSNAVDGLRQILWGLFKKVVIADNCAELVNEIFNNSGSLNGSTLFLGSVLFAFQIYGDFSGYSDIAIGVSKIFGFDLMRNFAYPYFSRDIAEFWRRWHISLSTWFRDYLYIPLGGSKGGVVFKLRNTLIIFLVSGFWHGANWTFIIWGLLNALYFIPILLTKKNRLNLGIVAENSALPSFKESLKMLVTFLITVVAWIFFRSQSVSQAFAILSEIFSVSFFEGIIGVSLFDVAVMLSLLIGFLIVEWQGRKHSFAIQRLGFNWPNGVRLGFYYVLVFLILVLGGGSQDFIYFQF